MARSLMLAIAFTLALAACSQGGGQSGGGGDDSPLIVATTTHLADFAGVVVGDRAEVYQVLGPGISRLRPTSTGWAQPMWWYTTAST